MQLAEFDVDVFYVSLDSPEKNAEFAASMGASLPVVSDPDGETAKRFGVLGFGGLYSKRWTFYIDSEGILRAIDKQVEPATAGADIIRKLEELNFPRRSSLEAGEASNVPGDSEP
jgi:peroxiredoxin Q/BCP